MSGATAKGPDRRVEPAHDMDRQTGTLTRITSPCIITTPVASDSRSRKRESADRRRSAQDESETDNILSVKKTRRTSTRSKLRSSLDESREPPMSDTDESPGVQMSQLPYVQKQCRPQSSSSQSGTMEQGSAHQEEETWQYECTTRHISQMITTLKESRKHIETTCEVSQRAAEGARAADDATNQLQTLGDGMELLIQSLEEEVQGPL
ncbi:hypothetical protein K439DRAFT_1622035 [Ramaria rubella]|nr:hypothetical protein K439DRAFT_1622035 [Ramaria rubella]